MADKPRILLIDDDKQLTDGFGLTLGRDVELTIASDLVEAYGALFDFPGVDNFDGVLIDLAIEMQGVSDRVVQKLMPELYTGQMTTVAKHALLGWDFYNRVLTQRPEVKDKPNEFFAFITGHYTSVIEMGLWREGDTPMMFDKADQELYRKMRRFCLKPAKGAGGNA